MKNSPPTKTEEILDLDYSEDEKIWLTGQKSLRKLVGILGVSLPLLLYVFLYIDTGHGTPLDSISHYYMTRVAPIFVIIVSLLAIFLLVYKGKSIADFYLSAAAGLFALCLILFPTNDISGDTDVIVTDLKDSSFRTTFHYISAAIFLLSLAAISIFLFTKSDKSPAARTPRKRMRNRLYRTCGIIMVFAILIIACGLLDIISEENFAKFNLTFWMETVAIESFGISWLVKGEVFLKDKPKTSKK